MGVGAEGEGVGLGPSIRRAGIMASGPVASWQVDGEAVEIVTDFVFSGPGSLRIVTAAMMLTDVCFLEEGL